MFSVECLMFRGRKTIMKTTKIFGFGHLSLVIGIVMLLLAGAVQAVEYKSSYRGVAASNQQSAISIQTTAPSVSFQSTSAYSRQWNGESTTPMLNSDGSVNGDAYLNGPNNVSGIRKAPGAGGPGTPGGELDPNAQQPVGDGLWVMILCALAYLIVRASRKRVY